MKKKISAKILAATTIAALIFGFAGTASAGSKSIELPPDGMQLTPSALPGYAKAHVNCAGCHSAEYMAYQPPTAPRSYWEAMVKRMKMVFKAPVDDEGVPVIVDYLVKTYGNEQSR